MLPWWAPVEEAHCWITGLFVQQSKAFCRKYFQSSKDQNTQS